MIRGSRSVSLLQIYCDHIRFSGEVSRQHSAVVWQRDGAGFGFQQILKKSFDTSEMMNIILSVQIAAGKAIR